MTHTPTHPAMPCMPPLSSSCERSYQCCATATPANASHTCDRACHPSMRLWPGASCYSNRAAERNRHRQHQLVIPSIHRGRSRCHPHSLRKLQALKAQRLVNAHTVIQTQASGRTCCNTALSHQLCTSCLVNTQHVQQQHTQQAPSPNTCQYSQPHPHGCACRHILNNSYHLDLLTSIS
jgi:hypothetical protein